MDASAIGHHCKEDGGGQEEEAEHSQHDPVQGMGQNLKKKTLKNYCKSEILPSTAPSLLLPLVHLFPDSPLARESRRLQSPQPHALQAALGRKQRGPESCDKEKY